MNTEPVTRSARSTEQDDPDGPDERMCSSLQVTFSCYEGVLCSPLAL